MTKTSAAPQPSLMDLKTFMAYLTRALRTKGCPSHGQTARKVYHHAICFEADHPGGLAAVSVQLDKLPRGNDAEWYRRNALAIFMEARLALKEQGIRVQAARDAAGRGRRERHAGRQPMGMRDVIPAALSGVGSR